MKINRKLSPLLLALCLALSLPAPALAAVSGSELEAAVSGSAEYMLGAVEEPQVGSTGGEWAVLGLARSGHSVPQEYWDGYYAVVEEYIEAGRGVLHETKYTEYSRLILALTAIGADPQDVAGYDLLTPLGDFDRTLRQGLNGPIWALIALDSGGYDMPTDPEAVTQATRQMYIDEILSRQLNDGGWSLTGEGGGGSADPDVTAMALQALAKYQSQTAVRTATEEALACLSAMQDADGGYSSWGSANFESVVQVMVALCELGLDPEDSRFVKNGNTLLDNLFSFRNADGSFLHTASGAGSSQMASEQGLCGLAAALRLAEGQSSFYRMDDVAITVSANAGGSAGLPGRHEQVKQLSVTVPGATFGDVSAHPNQAAIEALAARGVIDGMGDGLFVPDGTMTRAQFAAIVTRSLGLEAEDTGVFTDVASGQWYAGYIGTAHKYGIVNGVGGGLFAPEGTITREEAAVMVARAAALCGMDTGLDAQEVLNTLAQFTDYITVADWAREGMAFCYGEDILDQRDLNTEPLRPILRCEIAQMLFNMLDAARLI
ncbi:MAG: S-layer homology domain-containing protein [Bacillota bacterium]|nr:S-layer homology domain-containing protein [Bacillota bacterium]